MQKFDFWVSSEAIRAMEQNINLSDFSLSGALSLFPLLFQKSDKHRKTAYRRDSHCRRQLHDSRQHATLFRVVGRW